MARNKSNVTFKKQTSPYTSPQTGLIGQSNPYTSYVAPTQYPAYKAPTVPTTATQATQTQPTVKQSATSTYPQFDFNAEVAASLARAKAMETSNTTPTVTPTKTIADQYRDTTMTGVNADGTPYDPAYQDIENYYNKQANQNINEDDIYSKAAQRFQKEIDATNQIYAQKLAQQKEVSRGNLGTSTAISARAGALGSPIGEAQYKNVDTENQAVEGSILAEQAAVISAILGKGRKEAADEIAAKRAAKEAGTKEYLSFLKDKQVRKEGKLSNLAKQLIANKVDINTLDPLELAEIAKSYGVNANEIKSAYNDASATEKEKLISVSEGNTLYDPNTGEAVFTANKTYKPTSGGGSGYSGSGSGNQYSNDLDAIIGSALSTIPTKFGQATFQTQLSKSRNDADKINLVAAQVLKGSDAATKSDFRNQAVGVSNIDKAIAEIDAGTKTGVINSAGQYVFNVFGKDFDPKLAKINSYITAAIQPYRNSVTGAAWGEQEDGEYQSLFGSTKYSPAELRQRLVTIKEILKSKSAEGLNAYVNPLGYYDNQFASGAYAPSGGSDEEQELINIGYSPEQIQQLINAQ